MPFFWIREGSNFVAIKFTPMTAEKAAESFATPETSNLDNDLLEYFKGTSIGDAIEISLKDSGLKTERSLKVRVGKHAKLANRELEYRTGSDGAYLFRVSAINEVATTTTSNGTANANTQTTDNPNVDALTQEPTTGNEPATAGRGRR